MPGLTFPQSGPGAAHGNVHVAVQRRDRPAELLDPQPGDAAAVGWTLECTAVATAAGTDVKGPYVQGRPGARFVYLSWNAVDEAGTFTMFRRAKLLLDAVPAPVLDEAVHSGLLVGRLGLTDACGGPLCARVVPPRITWSAGARDQTQRGAGGATTGPRRSGRSR
ncbi:monooxygenase [Streptomyces sp. WM6373]|uniref:DUF5990 family protein n=1 Tax=Streptomyces virginiae TaxID=1961 RepID=UPI0006AE511A|nr:monooxygenase [Streptomyces sp. WM6373]KOU97386.1 monooxygenase [Streptomyces sp. XY58]KOV04012.1 monooxygenase [Streptomyces sp. XY37]KOV25704.1 monooxygenase [Streptomyces sp. XY413]KOV44352.1 monooxygenase [Streptomyces sp. MMG1064]KOV45411.1 monooxygenase [Streptomyces sp. H021]